MTYHCDDCGLDFSQTDPATKPQYKGQCPRCSGGNLSQALTGMGLTPHVTEQGPPVTDQSSGIGNDPPEKVG